VFVDLAHGMVILGVLIGAVFPFFAVMMGVPSPFALNLPFWGACLGAGVLLGAANWVLARRVIGKRLRLLARQMTRVGGELRSASARADWSSASPYDYRIAVESSDDLGRTAGAFNDLLAAVESERRFRSLVQAASDVICLVDADGVVTFVSGSITAVLGWEPEQVLGRARVAHAHAHRTGLHRAVRHRRDHPAGAPRPPRVATSRDQRGRPA
jgi:PAS domain S-box-containing protein